MHHGGEAAVTVRLAGVSPNAHGGRVVSTSGGVYFALPRSGGYVVNAKSPVKGIVMEGGPQNCQTQGSPQAKTVTCGKGPTYEVIAGAKPDYVGKPEDSNVVLAYH